MLESRDHIVSRFITLTYADDPGILDYRDFQLFMKSYREKFGACRFFAVGEYGGKTARGHYHAILFGHAPECRGFSVSLREVWKRGYCYDGTVNKDSVGYVAGYVFKDNYAPGKVPFVQMSLRPGIGMDRIAEMGRRVAALRLNRLDQWPTSYNIGNRSYPLCEGGLAKFQTEYLESGGLPPTISNPVARDLVTNARSHPVLGRGGAQIEDESNRSLALAMRYEDASALKKER